MTTLNPIDKLGELKSLLSLYDTAIERQSNLVSKTKKGKFKSAQVDDDVLSALVLYDLTLLKEQKAQVQKDIENYEADSSEKQNSDSA